MKIFDIKTDIKRIEKVLQYDSTLETDSQNDVLAIINEVKKNRDRAVAAFTKKFDGVNLKPQQFKLSSKILSEAWDSISPAERKVLQTSAKRIRAFHQKQKRRTWEIRDADNIRLMNRTVPLDSVGLYVPGGAAAYPSTVLMCAIPAKVAGVEKIVMVTPPSKEGRMNSITLAAAHLAGVSEVYQIGGAQAVAALAYGTKNIPKVDKVVGPGNVYVALAKRLLYGHIDIDSIAGPSEILVICDKTANPDWVAADLLSQAEHDPNAIATCIVIGSKKLSESIANAVKKQTAKATRKSIIEQSIKNNGAIIRVNTENQAAELANLRASEHLEIITKKPRDLAKKIRHAGSIFLGPWTPEAFGDYTAGTNHVLPTGGTARFFSPLSVDDYVKQMNWIESSQGGLKKLGPSTIRFAEMEGLDAHAESVRIRVNGDKK